MKIQQLETEKSVGQLLCHDITKIEKGVFKGALFKKGHRIRTEDVETLLDLGKTHIYALEPEISLCVDDADQIASAIEQMLGRGCNLIIVTGGMSVDPDDTTPTGIKKAGADIVKYGAPALPGAMFLLAYKGDVPLIGLPACAMYFKSTVLDIILPRLLAGERVTAAEIAALGHGGLCRRCETCFFPKCSFGKGSL